MDKYPVFREEQTVGELTVAPDALYTAFSVSCRGQEGLWCAWAVGERESLRIGVLEPENGCLQIRRRFSKRLTDPLGPILRGELRPLGEEREQWEPLRPELLRSPYLRCRLGGLCRCTAASGSGGLRCFGGASVFIHGGGNHSASLHGGLQPGDAAFQRGKVAAQAFIAQPQQAQLRVRAPVGAVI